MTAELEEFKDYYKRLDEMIAQSGKEDLAECARLLALVARASELANIGFPVHPHMLRHSTGYYLASKGHDTRAIQAYLGHRNIQHTVRYTELSPDRFKEFWRD